MTRDPHQDTPPIYQVETLAEPDKYPPLQIAEAFHIAYWLDRGTLILVEPPWEQ